MSQYALWTPEEDAILENEELTFDELVDLLPGRSRVAIYKRAQDRGLKHRGQRLRWTEQEVAILVENAHLPVKELQRLLPKRKPSAIYHKADELRLTQKSTAPHGEERPYRPLTEETAYQCRIEYNQKREYGYTHEQAVWWVAEANERDIRIVRDVLTNPKYDAQVEACKRKRSLSEKESEVLDDPARLEELIKLVREQRAASKKKYKGHAVIGTNIKTGKRLVFESARAAAAEGFDPTCIGYCVRKKLKSHKGYKWEILSDNE